MADPVEMDVEMGDILKVSGSFITSSSLSDIQI